VRTLSRKIWQSKNFHAHRHRVSSALAKTAFSRESPRPIRETISDRDDRLRFDGSGAMRVGVHPIDTATTIFGATSQ
jgi:hypothetical protein